MMWLWGIAAALKSQIKDPAYNLLTDITFTLFPSTSTTSR